MVQRREVNLLTDQELLAFQESMYHKHGMKVDVYHSEKNRVIGVFPFREVPHPFNALEVVQY